VRGGFLTCFKGPAAIVPTVIPRTASSLKPKIREPRSEEQFKTVALIRAEAVQTGARNNEGSGAVRVGSFLFVFRRFSGGYRVGAGG